MLTIYDCSYNEEGQVESFDTVDDAAEYAFTYLPTDDTPYMIGDANDGIQAFVFQGRVYLPGVQAHMMV